jgi:hypothetical protein
MQTITKATIAAAILATASFAAISQPSGPTEHPHPMMEQAGAMGNGPGMGMRGQPDPARMEQMMARHLADFKTKLKLGAEQEAAWTTFAAAMKPPARPAMQRPDPAQMEKLTTPERIDAMRTLRKQRMAEHQANQEKREEAIKSFYATLSAEQKKTFDSEHSRMARRLHERFAGHGKRPGPNSPAPADKPASK